VFGAWDWVQTLVAREDRPGLVWLRNAGGSVAHQTVELVVDRWSRDDSAVLAQLDNLLRVAAVLGPPDPTSDDELLARLAASGAHAQQPDAVALRAVDLLAERWMGWPEAEKALRSAVAQGSPTVRVAAARALRLPLAPVQALAPALEVLRAPVLYPNSLVNALRAAAPHTHEQKVAHAVTRCTHWLVNRVEALTVKRPLDASVRPDGAVGVVPWAFDGRDRWRPLPKASGGRRRTRSFEDVLGLHEELTYQRALTVAAGLIARIDSGRVQELFFRMAHVDAPAVRRAALAAQHARVTDEHT